MNQATLEAAILDRYPKLFPADSKDGSRLQFGCGPGWFPIIDHLCATVQDYIDNTTVLVTAADGTELGISPCQLTFDTIKQKLGTGRFYESLAPFPVEQEESATKATLEQARAMVRKTFEGMILFAEHLTAVTCEACGQPGELLNRKGYLAVRCPACAKREGFKPRPVQAPPSTRLILTPQLLDWTGDEGVSA